ncbi:MAG TPA: metallophosphoesterase [Geobacteraceae bacterium]|nr:metallophosphoesterase [Geobacteraceae bacterium]
MKPRSFVIADIHGCARTFRRLLHENILLRKEDAVFLLGDTIDRGPASREVIDEIRSLQDEGYTIRSVRGNHEEMLLRSCRDRNYFYLWMLNGGHETLRSFGVEDACEIPPQYRSLIESFPLFIELDGFILVHGGLNFAAADPLTDREAMLWSRDREVIKSRIGGRKVIGGHTPLDRQGIVQSLQADHIMLDNGCVYKGEPGLGSLCALELNSLSLLFQENIDFPE